MALRGRAVQANGERATWDERLTEQRPIEFLAPGRSLAAGYKLKMSWSFSSS